jgi:hypothetical protein
MQIGQKHLLNDGEQQFLSGGKETLLKLVQINVRVFRSTLFFLRC